MNQISRNLMLWAIIVLAMVMLFNMFQQPQGITQRVPYSDFLSQVDNGQLMSVTIQGHTLIGRTSDGKTVQSYAPQDIGLVNRLIEKKVEIKAEPPEEQPWYMTLLVSWFPMLLLVGVWIFFMRQMQSGGGKAMSFGRSRARLLNQDSTRVTFADVAGVDEAKDELSEVVEFLSNPKKFTRLGGRIPKGVLLVGPPGTGKTLLARAVAGEAGVPFFSISGSDFVEMFVGVGASRVRDLFVQGKKNAPCLIFIDEIDAVGRQRGAGLGGGHDEREQTLNQLLVEMDGFESNEGVILIAATNRPDVLDPALLRPGRFDRQVMVPTPDLRGRRRILEVHTKRTPLAGDVDLEVLARGTPGFSGADLENLVNEAALQAAKLNQDRLDMHDFEYAKDKVLMGRERRSLILSEEEKRITAYHEGGHALAARLLPGSDPVHKVTIIPRGRALGVTMQLPEEDRHGYSRTFLRNNLVVLLGGRVAEEIIFDDITTGASNDIERVTRMARKMVCEWGMSEAVGTLAIGETGEEVFIGREWVQNKNFSEDTARLVDSEVKRIVEDAHSRCRKLLEENLDALHRIAQALLDRETITGADIDLLMDNKELPPLDNNGKPVPSTAAKGGKASKSGAEFVIEPDTDAQAPEQKAEHKQEQQSEQAESKQSETENTRNNSKENDR
ncbi:protease, ATP-dependent zinc-metallo [uncultured Desulfovibrio sp.]|uniref:ATP-dependent zinc metalloprotease FtsH n=1 Tax=uncultured Desulfovibrio sp. TaxID=167968 RepID=A0A212J4H2_9BACT|nr:ATP-dependent zinc metalloprotease FtsH [Desulfovibrio desulfuricans]MCB6540650.1 ATP-dependent zinc metalloprotease FtsH [Desulfovibrio desulfuricans]MCB6551732.1 ATP-dependent zinc metalloprotease FtsH [Desulfovibrio desulfuricans]MCB6563574.1 ATP-dependent zinc metalloprotease FtsH [Desulfovibrio desulfuricans]MCB7344836.1 ATP-dependent zinc metalloprotease FtsH [Desulfovibrio desulfuricans]MCQ4860181.1 ATP-dependent zinc metalloprotease FtsH [Desulfovibrio desulfuricans]